MASGKAGAVHFDIDQIQTLLALQDHPDQSCHDADSIAKARLA
tara:strand:- start:529 stop:657 length:129 start_codon:yes stop_codon:yes gene_type:complete